ncbi:PQQ-dependent sugar dehydrogenase [Oleiharenicola lentus]|uniref:PQQ-dependent sugar dehydrogenase n=1 Tax=Oleiharenicola lentus TaxID=2508720 RepID=UPI003F66A083
MRHSLLSFVFFGAAAILSAQPADMPKVVHRVTAAPYDSDLKRERVHYEVTPFKFSPDLVLEGGGIDVLPDNRIVVSTRRGELWLVDNAFSADFNQARYTLFATGLHEPLSVFWKDGWFYVTERNGITRVRDTDGDNRADVSEIVTDQFGVTGNFHEYAFSSHPDRDGNIWSALCLSNASTSPLAWRGWAVRVTPEGKIIPTAAGIRSPGGIGFNPAGDVFYTDNQGDWNGSSSLKHLAHGSFQGAPPSLAWWEKAGSELGSKPLEPSTGRILTDHAADPKFIPPAVVIPHNRAGRSPTAIVYDKSGKFGPFGQQLFVAEHTFSQISRVFLEKVNGIYQGAVFPFIAGLESGPIGMAFGPDGSLFVTGSARGWGAKGGKSFHFERIRYRGQSPFEPLEIRAQADGFLVSFTEPVDPATAGNPAAYAIEAWTYLHSKAYGSEELERITPTIASATVAADGMSVRLVVTPLTRGHVHELKFDGVRNSRGESLVHPIGWYTLNEIPAR